MIEVSICLVFLFVCYFVIKRRVTTQTPVRNDFRDFMAMTVVTTLGAVLLVLCLSILR